MAEEWRTRLLGSRRGQVLALLRRAPATVGELSSRLALTANAVRLHLSVLERDGLVEQHGTRREGTGKPAGYYRATREAEAVFPKPYHQVLAQLLSVLAERGPAGGSQELLREVGARLGRGLGSGKGSRRERFEHAARVVTELGGLAEVQEDDVGLLLQGYACPLGAVTAEHPEVCQLAESLVGVLAGEPVRDCCERGERPRCAFRPAVEAVSAS